eukprot:395657-Pleurochrysis_carterae.AAC.10
MVSACGCLRSPLLRRVAVLDGLRDCRRRVWIPHSMDVRYQMQHCKIYTRFCNIDTRLVVVVMGYSQAYFEPLEQCRASLLLVCTHAVEGRQSVNAAGVHTVQILRSINRCYPPPGVEAAAAGTCASADAKRRGEGSNTENSAYATLRLDWTIRTAYCRATPSADAMPCYIL